jgi:hypothetical protein
MRYRRKFAFIEKRFRKADLRKDVEVISAKHKGRSWGSFS